MALYFRVGRSISKSESVVLDTARASAALMVFLSHWSIFTGWLPQFQSLGRIGVLIFFVLSGFLIAAASEQRSARSYIVARAARLYSVTLPVLIVLPILGVAVAMSAPTRLPEFLPPDVPATVQWLASITFTNYWWFLNVPTFSDGPFWSLSYEAAFYVVWGAWVFSPSIWWTVLAAALVGPAVILLFPIWLLGALLYRSGVRLSVSGAFIALPIAAVLGVVGRQIGILPSEWGFSTTFVSDWLRGTACLLILMSSFPLVRIERLPLATWIATRSFTLYLTHYPLLKLSTLLFVSPGLPTAVAIGGGILAICLGLGSVLEPTNKSWREVLRRLLPDVAGGRAA